jgi:uncharacterized protein YjbI with pentapeptide repeats
MSTSKDFMYKKNDDDSVAILYDEDDIMNMNLRDMTDKQIQKYIDMIGREPRDEIYEWSMDFKGGPIVRYSYVNFAESTLSNKKVSNIAIIGAQFSGSTLRNYVFENVQFYDCDFKSVILKNVKFKNASFIGCDLEPYIFLDNSCNVEKFDCDEDHC